jgi:hypothetical protein
MIPAIDVARLERQRCLDELYEWCEIGVECDKPNPVINQLVEKIQSMRNDTCIRIYNRKKVR